MNNLNEEEILMALIYEFLGRNPHILILDINYHFQNLFVFNFISYNAPVGRIYENFNGGKEECYGS